MKNKFTVLNEHTSQYLSALGRCPCLELPGGRGPSHARLFEDREENAGSGDDSLQSDVEHEAGPGGENALWQLHDLGDAGDDQITTPPSAPVHPLKQYSKIQSPEDICIPLGPHHLTFFNHSRFHSRKQDLSQSL